jgi:type I restriction enzyme, S subunit
MSEVKNIPKHWQIVKVGEYVISVKGKKPKRVSSIKTKEYCIPYVNIKAFEKNVIDEYTDGLGCILCEDDDFLMVWDGSRSGYVGKAIKGALGSTLMKLKFPNIDINYAYYFLQSKYIEINTRAKGVGIPHVDPNILWNYNLPIPPLPEQHLIVSKIEELLSDLDNGKQQLQTAQQQLKIYRQSLLKWAFEGKFTNQNLNDGELPKEWILKKFIDIGTWKGGGTPSKSRNDFWENGSIFWVSPKDMKSQRIIDTIDKITLDAIENSSTKLIPTGSILFVVRSGILRRTLPIALTICDVTVNQDIQAFTPDEVLPEYIYWYVSAKNDDIRKNCSKDGTTVESIESSLLKNYYIPICSLDEQQRIIDELESKLTVCDKIEETISQSLLHAETLRQSILKKAFEGKLV